MKLARVAIGFSLLPVCLFAAEVSAQVIQRCEGANGRITYANGECPTGTKAVKALPPVPQPSAESRAAAQAKLQRYKDEAKVRTEQKGQQKQQTASDAVQKAADCGYLQASIDSSRRLRNVLTTRPYYSTEDVDEADARTKELTAEYRRVCG